VHILSVRWSPAMLTPSTFRQRLRVIPDSGAGSGTLNTPTPAPTVAENHLAGLTAIQPQIVPIRPCLNICQFNLMRRDVPSLGMTCLDRS